MAEALSETDTLYRQLAEYAANIKDNMKNIEQGLRNLKKLTGSTSKKTSTSKKASETKKSASDNEEPGRKKKTQAVVADAGVEVEDLTVLEKKPRTKKLTKDESQTASA